MAILDKYSRSRYFPKNNIDGINENDLAFSGFSDYVFKDKFKSYTVTQSDLQRPDLISGKIFQKPNYWWIVMKLNNICDIWNDLTVGLTILIPSENDIQGLITFMQAK